MVTLIIINIISNILLYTITLIKVSAIMGQLSRALKILQCSQSSQCCSLQSAVFSALLGFYQFVFRLLPIILCQTLIIVLLQIANNGNIFSVSPRRNTQYSSRFTLFCIFISIIEFAWNSVLLHTLTTPSWRWILTSTNFCSVYWYWHDFRVN